MYSLLTSLLAWPLMFIERPGGHTGLGMGSNPMRITPGSHCCGRFAGSNYEVWPLTRLSFYHESQQMSRALRYWHSAHHLQECRGSDYVGEPRGPDGCEPALGAVALGRPGLEIGTGTV